MVGQPLNFSGYGHWLPNDPRGSSSHEVRNPAIAELGELHHGRKRVQPSRLELRAFHLDAAEVLEHPVLWFDEQDVAVLADCFRETIRRHNYTCWGCALMPNHVHLLIRMHRDNGDAMMKAFQDESREALQRSNPRWADHPVWGGPGWKAYLFSADDARRIERYIGKNVAESPWPAQAWDFVQPYNGWLPGNMRTPKRPQP
ncbi:MAG: transposase [Gemmataceae bacterium]|nr:transposase [Gemmataceae bacterium]